MISGSRGFGEEMQTSGVPPLHEDKGARVLVHRFPQLLSLLSPPLLSQQHEERLLGWGAWFSQKQQENTTSPFSKKGGWGRWQ